MDDHANTKTVQQVYENFANLSGEDLRNADMEPLLDLYSDDVEWDVPDMENVPFAGKRRGREGVKDFFSLLVENLDVVGFETQEFIAQGDKVVALGRYSWRVKATGREFSSDFAHVCTVRDGKIVRFHEYMDTAAEVKAYKKGKDRRE